MDDLVEFILEWSRIAKMVSAAAVLTIATALLFNYLFSDLPISISEAGFIFVVWFLFVLAIEIVRALLRKR